MERVIATESTGNGDEVRIHGLKRESPRPGDEVTINQSFSSPPAISHTTYRITRIDADGGVYGVQTGYALDELDIEDLI